MFIPLLLIITLSTSLHGMEITIQDETQKAKHWNKELISNPDVYLKNKCYQSDNVDKYGKYINLAAEKRAGLLLAHFIHLCLPPEVVQIYIDPYLSEPIATKYKHTLINHKGFTIKYINHDRLWDVLPRHDGTYSTVPTGHEYTMWKESNTDRRNCFTFDNKKYDVQLISTNKEGILRKLAVIDTDNPDEQNKKFILSTRDKDNTTMTRLTATGSPISHHLFSNDNTLLAFGCSENIDHGTMQIYDVKTQKGLGWNLNGSVSALCAAHHSPLFVIGSNKPDTVQQHNIHVFITWEDIQCLEGHYAPITHVEFSPDDTRLLTCSYDKATDVSRVSLWDTSNLNMIVIANRFKCAIHKAFFICNGEKIMVMQKNGAFGLLDGLTGKSIKKDNKPICKHHDFSEITHPKTTPLIIWNNKNKLIISALDDKILFYSSETDKLLGVENHSRIITSIGLTADENTIVFVDENENAYTLPLYEDDDYNYINFIKEQANIVQLYEMFALRYKNKNSDASISFFSRIKSYIQEQQKKLEKK